MQQNTSQKPHIILHKYNPPLDSNKVKLYKKKAKIKREVITNHLEAYFEKKYPPENEPKIRPK